LFLTTAYAQKADSLLNQYLREPSPGPDLLNELGGAYLDIDADSSYLFLSLALERSDELSYPEGRATANFNLGRLFYQVGRTEEALQFFAQAVNTFKGMDDALGEARVKLGIARSYFEFDDYIRSLEYARSAMSLFRSAGDSLFIARTEVLFCDLYNKMGNHDLALESCIRSNQVLGKLGDRDDIVSSLNSLGRVYVALSRYNDARTNFFNALALAEQFEDEDQLSATYQTIGQLYYSEGLLEEAIRFYNNALLINLKGGDKSDLAVSYLDIGKVYIELLEYENAIRSLERSHLLAQQTGDLEIESRSLMNLGKANVGIGNSGDAIELFKSSLKLAMRINARPILRDVYQAMAVYYDEIGDKENAFINFNLYMRQNEAIYTSESARKVAEAQALYNLEQKENEIDLLRKEKEIQSLLAKERVLYIYGLVIIAVLGTIILIILFSRYRFKVKANELLTQQKDEINVQKEKIEVQSAAIKEINLQLTDSIHYARTIQDSFLPANEILKQFYPESFIFFKPRDIISGDFYWFQHIRDTFVLAAIDCTGHGVPGAFMTVLANSLLNQIVREGKLTDPELILTLLDKKVQDHLNQRSTTSKEVSNDGMDMALCTISLSDNQVYYTGAQIPLYHVHNGSLRQLAPNRFPVGSAQYQEKKFEVSTFKPEKGDAIYLASDGFQDQFGGPNNKKFMKKAFKDYLYSIHDLPFEIQETRLEQMFSEWRGSNEQTDDVLVIGLKFT
jgi:tetratricopeptide (TPR) repeat protein